MDSSLNIKTSVVIPAGGIGERLGLIPAKQFCLIDGKPLLCFAVEAFERLPWINHIIIVVAQNQTFGMQKLIDQYDYKKTRVAVGGSTRFRSIIAGLKFLEDDAPEVVVIHDAVRPLVPVDILTNVVFAAREHSAAGPICPLTSTVVSTDENGFLNSSLDRQKFHASEMPQAFIYHVIMRAFNQCTDQDLDLGTECLHVVDKYCNVKAKLIKGSPELWKVTYMKDLCAAENILRRERSYSIISMGKLQQNYMANQILSSLKMSISGVHEDGLLPAADITPRHNVIFHLDCPISDMMNCCGQQNSLTFKTIIHIVCNAKSQVDFSTLHATLKQWTDTNCKEDQAVFIICKTRQDWSQETINQLINIIKQLLLHNCFVLSGQIFIV